MLIGQIEFILRNLVRLSDRFDIEKEYLQEEESIRSIRKLMDRSRTFFQPECAALISRINRVRSRIREGEGAGEVERAAAEAEQQLRKILAWFVSTPHRLLRSFEAVQGSGTGSGSGEKV